MVARRPISLRLDAETLDAIDRAVAAAPSIPYVDRTEWIRKAIAEKLARASDPDMVAVPSRPSVSTLVGNLDRSVAAARAAKRDVTPIPKHRP